MRRFINLPLTIGEEISLKDEDYNYIARVLRSREGDSIVLFNGQGGEYHGVITEIAKRFLTVKIKKFNPANRTSSVKIHLLQSLAKGEKMELILQKGTELGLDEVTPLTTERSVVHLKTDQMEKRVDRWKSIVTSACEQCGLNIPPKVHTPISLEKWLTEVLPTIETTIISLAPVAHSSLGKFLNEVIAKDEAFFASLTKEASKSITIVIGPEGGLSENEIALLEKNGAHSVTLGDRILRTETAALAVISTIQGSIGDWAIDRIKSPVQID